MAGDTLRTLRVELTGGSGVLQKSLRDAAQAAGRMGVELKAVQGQLDKVTAARPTADMKALELAVRGLGGTANLTGAQLGRVTLQVNQLAAAGAKVPASLSGLTGIGSKFGAAFASLTTGGGVAGALSALGPAGVVAAGAFGAVAFAGTKAYTAVAELADKAEEWSNTAKSTGLGMETVQQLSQVMTEAQIAPEALRKGMKALSAEIASGGKDIAKFGIDITGWDLMTQEQRLQAFAQAVAGIEDPAIKSAAAQAGLGRAGTDLIPILDDVASGAYKMIETLGPEQVRALAETDKALDEAGRNWELWKNRALASIVPVFNYLSKPVRISTTGIEGGIAGLSGGFAELARISSPETYLDKSGLTLGPEEEEARKASAKAAKESAKEQEEISSLLADAAKSARKLAFQILDEAKKKAGSGMATTLDGVGFLPQGRDLGMGAMVGARNFDFGLDAQGFITWGDAGKDAAEKAKEATKETETWTSTLGTLADQLQGLAQTTGGLTGDIVGFAASLSSGLGGAISGFNAMKDIKGGGFKSVLGKVAGGLGMVGSIIGVAGSLFSGIKSLFGGKSKEQKAAEKAAAEEAKRKAEEEALQAKIKSRQDLEAGLGRAAQSAESLQAKIADGSVKSSAAIEALFGAVNGALMKYGIGTIDARLTGSKEFTGAQGAAQDVAGMLGGMRTAGVIDAGVSAVGAQAAEDLRKQAQDAATAQGLDPQGATRAGLIAIAPILREQLNAAMQSGNALDAKTQALLDEAKANGIEILADPALQSLNVQKEQLGVLKQIAGTPSGASNTSTTPTVPSLPENTPSFADGGWGNFGSGTAAILHGPEAIIPLDALESGGYTGGGGDVFNIAPVFNDDPLQTFEGVLRQRAFTLKTMQREMARDLAAAVASGRA
jgi:hypothetical protein